MCWQHITPLLLIFTVTIKGSLIILVKDSLLKKLYHNKSIVPLLLTMRFCLHAQFSHNDGTDGDAMMMLVPARYQFINRYQSSTLQGQLSFTHHS